MKRKQKNTLPKKTGHVNGHNGRSHKKPKQQITIRIEDNVIRYFKKLASRSGMPYQNLINLYLRDCIQNRRKPHFKWSL